MLDNDFLTQVADKNAAKDKIIEQVYAEPKLIDVLFEGMANKKPTVKYGSERIIRAISEDKPELIYPYFDRLVVLMNSSNNVLKQGAIMILANLAVVDFDDKLDDLFEEYFKPLKGPVIITAGHIISSSPKIALEKPYMTERIVKEILLVERGKYQTADCKNIAIGHAIDAFAQFIELIQDKKSVFNFVKRHVNNPRENVRKSATRFLKKFARFNK